jgi:hypothetical protein
MMMNGKGGPNSPSTCASGRATHFGFPGFTARVIRSRSFILILLAATLVAQRLASEEIKTSTVIVGHFSGGTVGTGQPEGWRPLTFRNTKRHTLYSLVADDGTTVLQATAEASASGLVRSVRIDPKEYPLVAWRWKVSNVLTKGDVYRKEGDDYPARLYITFEYNPAKLGILDTLKYRAIKLLYGEVPLRAINYVWDSKGPQDTMVPNAYTSWVMMVVVESGKTRVGSWVKEERSIYDDYKKAFGEEPGMITGVAVMTDTDNTGESATGYYGDIIFERRNEGEPS